MKLTVLGSAGSLPYPGNPASGYFLSFSDPDTVPLLLDIGSGILTQLQAFDLEPGNCHVALSHMHADHCSDFTSLMVWRRYHPTRRAQNKHALLGPSHTQVHLGRMGGDDLEDVDNFSDSFDFQAFEHGVPTTIEQATITPYRTVHPTETYALRIEDHVSGKVIAYSADSAYTEDLLDCAREADYFLCEAAWGPTAQDKISGMHMSGADAGELASKAGVKTLVLTHLQPWSDVAATMASAKEYFSGPILNATPGDEFVV